MKWLESSANTLGFIQLFAIVATIVGLFTFEFSSNALLITVLFYFLYSGVGISMMYHRYWTHKSFKMNSFLVWLCSFFGIVTGRGSIVGWVYVHRLHHKYSDTEKDPHRPPNYKKWKVFFPHLMGYGEKMNVFVVRDLLTKTHARIGKYYLAIVLGYAGILFVISPALFYFAWALPVAITNIMYNTFLVAGHEHGYTNHAAGNESTNTWPFGYLLWGEGWHNNHHAKPGNYNFGSKWWEFDPIGYLIERVKK